MTMSDAVPAARKAIDIVRCSHVHECIEVLKAPRPGGSRRPYGWAFRGQADAKWPLTPKALRPGTVLGFLPDRRQFTSNGYGASLDQANGELVAVRQFAELADRVGLPIPGFHPIFRQDGFDLDDCEVAAVGGHMGTMDWPKPEMLELLAIAQHHGVPTRLLDFTYDPLTALFFAAEDCVVNKEVHEKNGVREFAVWGVDTHKLYLMRRAFTVVEVERAKNPFLRAQKGLFVLDRGASAGLSGIVSPPLEERIETVFQNKKLEGSVVVKIMLPVTEAACALEELASEGIDDAHLRPTFDNVVAFLKRKSSRG